MGEFFSTCVAFESLDGSRLASSKKCAVFVDSFFGVKEWAGFIGAGWFHEKGMCKEAGKLREG